MKIGKVLVLVIMTILDFGLCSAGIVFSNRTSSINLKSGSRFNTTAAITNFTGSLIKDVNAQIFGSNITFNNGTFEEDGSQLFLSAVLNPTTTKLVLSGSSTVRSQPGRLLRPFTISGTNNRIEGQPIFTSPLILDASATLTLAIQGSMLQNIQFDAGGTNTIRLENDLSLDDGATIVNNGTISLNKRKLTFGGRPLILANTIYWYDAGDINLMSKITLNGTWNTNSEQTINGNGNILDLSGGGKLSLASSTTLRICNTVIKGIKNTSFVFGDSGSTLRFSNVTLRLDESVTSNNGLFFVDGPSTIYLINTNWVLAGQSKLTVSGVSFWKDRLSSPVVSNITGNLDMINNGTIRCVVCSSDVSVVEQLAISNSNAIVKIDNKLANMDSTPGDVTINQIISSPGAPVSFDIYLAPNHRLSFTQDISLNGSTHFIYLSQAAEPVLIVDSGVSVTLKDFAIFNFSEDKILLNAGASLVFGDKTKLEIDDPTALSKTWTCSGAVTFNGNEKRLSVGAVGGFYVMAGSSLIFQNAYLDGLSGEKIKCEDNSASIVLRNTELRCSDTFSFKKGSILFDQNVNIDDNSVFCYESSAASTVSAKSVLSLALGSTFSYSPPTPSSDLLVFEDNLSTLVLDGGTLYTTQTGINLRTGRMKVTSYSYISAEGSGNITFGNDSLLQDFTCLFSERTKLKLLSGSIAYRNVNMQSFRMLDEPSELVIDTNAKLKLYQSLNTINGTIHFGANSYLLLATGKTLSGAIAADGNINYGVLP